MRLLYLNAKELLNLYPENFGNIFTNSFVLVKFIYNEGTKKETEKKIVLQILEVNKTEKFNSQPAYPLNFVQ
jgi:hypothetical protein